MSPGYSDLGLEAVGFQKGSMFFKELTLLLTRAYAERLFDTDGLDKLKISAVIKKYTNLNVTVKVLTAPMAFYNASATPPVLNNDSIGKLLLNELGYDGLVRDLTYKRSELLKYSKELKGTIDSANGRVSGLFSKIPLTVSLGAGLPQILTIEETAASLLHEIGHLYTFFEMVVDTVSTNMAIASASEALAATDDRVKKLKLVYEYAENTGHQKLDADAIASAQTDAAGYQILLLRDYLQKKPRSSTDSLVYDLRGMEFAADHFASMWNAGRALVSAIDKIERYTGGNNARQTDADWLLSEAMRVAAGVLGVILTPLYGGVLTSATNAFYTMLGPYMEHRVYDEQGARTLRIRRNLVQALKDRTLSKAEQASILSDIDFIDKLSSELKDRRSLLNLFWISLTPTRRRQYNQLKFQQQLETVVNNNLFVTASKLNQLASKGV